MRFNPRLDIPPGCHGALWLIRVHIRGEAREELSRPWTNPITNALSKPSSNYDADDILNNRSRALWNQLAASAARPLELRSRNLLKRDACSPKINELTKVSATSERSGTWRNDPSW